jgi:hypothetical protein
MTMTLHDITPVGLCIATQELFDAKRFQQNFGDHILLRAKDNELSPSISDLKKELNSQNQKKFIEGHKVAIISNIDKIMSLVTARYHSMDMRVSENVIQNSKDLILRVMYATSFNDIARLEPIFKSGVTLPVYELFMNSMKKSRISVI